MNDIQAHSAWRGEFPMLDPRASRPMVYLDSAATSLKPRRVIDAVQRHYAEGVANVHRAVHPLGEAATEAFEACRARAARTFGVSPEQVVFTRGCTHGIHLVARGRPDLRRVVTCVGEHHSNYLPWLAASRRTERPVELEVVGVDAEGRVDMEQMQRVLTRPADLVAVSHVGNAVGAVQPIEAIAALAARAGADLLVDAAQSASKRPIDFASLGAAYLVCSSHKMLAPSGAGLLLAAPQALAKLRPSDFGGDMVEAVTRDDYTPLPAPRGLEAGTPPIEAVIGLGEALRFVDDVGLDAIREHDRQLVAYALARLGELPAIRLLGPTDAAQRAGSVSFVSRRHDSHVVAQLLGAAANVCVRSGYLCAQPLHEAIGAPPSVRMSFHLYNDRSDLDLAIDALGELLSSEG